MAKYFVTGATGFIGGRVTRQLVAAGHNVVAIARSPESARDLESIGVDVRRGDITNPDSLRGPMVGVDGVFHIAGWYKIGSKDPSEGERINVAGTRNVLSAMKELRVPKGVYTSTLAVFSDTHGQLVDETYRHRSPDHRDPSAPVPRVAWVPPRDCRAVPVRAASRCGGSDLSREQRKGAPRARIRPEAPGGWTPRNVAARDAIARNPPRCKLMLLREEFLK